MSVGAPYDITDLAHAIVYNPCLDELLVRALASLLLDDPSVILLCLLYLLGIQHESYSAQDAGPYVLCCLSGR